jgi:biotin operon repressor
MEVIMETPDTEQLVRLFKALGDESRLRIVGLLAQEPQSGEAIARALNLSPATVSHHLAKLKDVGLVTAERDQYYQIYRFCPAPLTAMAKTLATPAALPQVKPKVTGDEEILANFLVEGRLTKIPAQRKKREVVLGYLASQFEPDRRYPEKEVNTLLQRYHDDVCTLRRELVMAKLLDRQGGVYWRTAHTQAVAPVGQRH